MKVYLAEMVHVGARLASTAGLSIAGITDSNGGDIAKVWHDGLVLGAIVAEDSPTGSEKWRRKVYTRLNGRMA